MNPNPNRIKVIYQDAHLLAAHKPAGLATYRESRGGHAHGCKEVLEDQLNERLFPVHRIDADTSGLVLFAKDSRTAAALIRAFKEHQIKKTYLAWCVGAPPPKGSIKTPLKKHKSELTESARTDYVLQKRERGHSLVQVFPFTGRFHQIRRHFESIGHPLVGDPIYGNPEAWSGFFKSEPRLMLQAESVEFTHPAHRKPIKIKTREKL
jgi:RluA family pseudouridine synthase